MDAALEGVSVIDLTHCIAGPYCTKLLAGFGADVLKIEPPEGERGRRMGPFYRDEPGPDSSLSFAYLNTGKRSATLNLKSVEGRDMLLSLLGDADVLVENFSPRVMPSLGLDYDTVREVAPHLVMVSISNFGQTGPYRDYRAADIVEYALGGLMYIFGAYDREPLKHAFNQAQFKAGTDAASATLMALYHQRMTGGRASGQGQHVDVFHSGGSGVRPSGRGEQLHLHRRHTPPPAQPQRRPATPSRHIRRLSVAQPGAGRWPELGQLRGVPWTS